MAAGKNSGREDYRLIPEDAPFEEGFNIKTLWGALFVGFVMMPGAIYLGLVIGQALGGAAQWVTIILFVEVAKRAFVRLKPQEILILYWIAGGLVVLGGGFRIGLGAGLFGGPFGMMIWDQYFVNSPQAAGLAHYIPQWLAPKPGSGVFMTRSFLHREWLVPICILMTCQILFVVNQISLGYTLFRVTSDVERLPFPMAPVYAGGAMALAETSGRREGWRWRVFSVGSMIGVIWGFAYVAVPTISNILLVKPVTILPIPWMDFTPYLKAVLPAAPLAVVTDLWPLLAGFVLPFWVVIGSFIGQIGRTLLVNPILYRSGILRRWTPGMTYVPTAIANNLDFWISFSIGLGVVVALAGIWSVVKAFKSQRAKGLHLTPPKGRGDIWVGLAFLAWAVSTLGFVALVHVLVPEFPLWIIAFFGFVFTPMISYITARMVGLTGSSAGVSFPFLRESLFYLSGYKGVAIWFAPVPIFNHGGLAEVFKQLELVRTKFGSYVKMAALSMGIMLVCSFLFWSLIWKLAPIPSAAYPYVHKVWPYFATMQAMWASSTLPGGASLIQGVINLKIILTGLGAGGLTFALFSGFGLPISLFYGILAGAMSWMPTAVPSFVGGMLGRYYFLKRFGRERWRAYAPIILAGYACGLGLIGMVSVAITLIARSVSTIVF
ncbi:MAG TPA: peptide transporter [Candidatus Latescibacteria bacterium]|nr:peptide transporter [Candidatus Latescibacterota bacterium]